MCILQHAGIGVFYYVYVYFAACWQWGVSCVVYMCILQHAHSGLLAVLCICVFCSMLAVGC